jgi:glycosyltransferase involved in cell wall biosynthesis
MDTPGAYTQNREIGIIIPAYNPSVELVTLCRELAQQGFSLFVVNDGSEDTSVFKTLETLPLILLHHAVNLGQGAALETGIRKALLFNINTFITFDADGQHSCASVADLLQVLQQEKTDIVFGSRFLEKKFSESIPRLKKTILKVAALFDGLLTGIWLTDSHNGLRAFNRRVAEKIHFTENRMAHATEILWLTRRYRWNYKECAVLIKYDRKSQHPVRSIEIAIDLFLRKLIS